MRVARMALLFSRQLTALLAVAAPARAQTIPRDRAWGAPPWCRSRSPARRPNVQPRDHRRRLHRGRAVQVPPQVDKHLNVLWSIEPYKSYRNYINVYAVEIVSGESGVDCDPDLTVAAQGHPAEHGLLGRLQPDQRAAADHREQHGRHAYADLVPGAVSQPADLALANSGTYGGAGGAYATASGGNAMSALISPARDRPLARRPAGRVRLLPARRARRRLHRRRAHAPPTTRC